jgi:hypothetical protein
MLVESLKCDGNTNAKSERQTSTHTLLTVVAYQ